MRRQLSRRYPVPTHPPPYHGAPLLDAFLEIFSFSGRANRARYFWHVLLDDLVIVGMVALLLVLSLGTSMAILPVVGVACAGLWAALAVTARTAHP